MKSPYIASSLLLALLAAPLALAQDAPPVAPAGSPAASSDAAPAPAKPKKTELAKDMDKVNRAVRTLKKQINDASQNDSSLALVATIHDAAVAASKETPAFTADQPQADQAKFVADYQDKMKEFIGDIDKLTAALKGGDNAGAAKLLAGLGQDEKTAHKQFRKPEEKN